MTLAIASHISREDLELFVIAGLDEHRAADVEAHVAECPVCSAALAREAELEMALLEVAAKQPARAHGPRPVVPRPRTARVIVAAVGTLSLAAAWMLWLGGTSSQGHSASFVEPQDRTTARVVASMDAGGALSLDAHRDPLDGS